MIQKVKYLPRNSRILVQWTYGNKRIKEKLSWRVTTVYVKIHMQEQIYLTDVQYTYMHMYIYMYMYLKLVVHEEWSNEDTTQTTHHFLSGIGLGTVLIRQGAFGWPDMFLPNNVPTRFSGTITNNAIAITTSWNNKMNTWLLIAPITTDHTHHWIKRKCSWSMIKHGDDVDKERYTY